MAQQPLAMLRGSTAISHASWLNSRQPCFMAQQPLAMRQMVQSSNFISALRNKPHHVSHQMVQSSGINSRLIS
jgi:hypothetical protein